MKKLKHCYHYYVDSMRECVTSGFVYAHSVEEARRFVYKFLLHYTDVLDKNRMFKISIFQV